MLKINRRQVLAGGASGIMAAPFVRLLNPPARASTGEAHASRLLVFFTPNGTIHDHWRPSGGELDFAFPAGSIMESLTPHKDDLLVIDGMDFSTGDNHEGGMRAMLTGNQDTSIDQVIAAAIGTQLRTARSGVSAGGEAGHPARG